MLNKINVKNFKCFLNHQFDFNGLTFLTGGNATGKTSLLQVLSLLSQFEKDGNIITVTPKWNNLNIGNPDKILSYEGEETVINIEVECDNMHRQCNLSLMDSVDYQYKFVVNTADLEFFKKKLFIRCVNAERISPKSRHIIGMSGDYVGVNGEYAVEAISLFEKKRSIVGGDLYPFLDNKKISFRRACELCLSKIFGHTELRITNDDGSPTRTLSIKNNFDFYEPIATGFGISYSLPIIVQCLIALIDKKGILVIENPEAHLHPKSQSELGKFLAEIARLGVQIIVETHSEHIITGSCLVLGNEKDHKLMNTIFFSNNEGKFQQRNLTISQFGEMEEWPEGFFDQSESDLREILMRKISRNGTN